MKVVGARIPRYDGIAHVTGRTTYVDDVRIPGTLWVKALRSPEHSATITRLDTTAGRGDGRRARRDHARGRPASRIRAPGGARHPRGRALAREGRGALPGPADRARRRGRRGDGRRGRVPDRARPRDAAGDARRAAGFRRRRALLPPVGEPLHPLRGRDGPPSDPQGRHRLGVRERGHDRPGRLPPRGDRARADRDAGLPGRPRAERPAHDLLLHAGALLLDGRRRRAPAGAAQQAEVRRRHDGRGLRGEGRHRHRDDVRAPRAEVRENPSNGAGRGRRSSSAPRPARRGTWRSRTR